MRCFNIFFWGGKEIERRLIVYTGSLLTIRFTRHSKSPSFFPRLLIWLVDLEEVDSYLLPIS